MPDHSAASAVFRSQATFRLDGLVVDIRSSVAFREHGLNDGVMFYLSLLDDEINDRIELILALSGAARATCARIAAVADHIELTDAIVLRERSGKIVVLRGGACTFSVFYRRSATEVHLSTALPLFTGATFSKSGLVSAAAAAHLHSSYEPNACTDTPLLNWHRIRRGSVTTFSPDGTIKESVIIDQSDNVNLILGQEAIAKDVRAAFIAYVGSQRHVRNSVVELSGGFDSTLAAAAARTPQHAIRGVSVEFPYYEFRFEADVQKAVSTALNIPRTVFDGTQMFPYALSARPPCFDEPAIFVTGIRHAEAVADFAAEYKATRIYTGHGGDQLFSTDLTVKEITVDNPLTRGPFSRQAWRVMEETIRLIRQPTWRDRSVGTFVYDARQDVWIKETFGVTIRTPFSDLAVFRAAQTWSRWCASRNVRPDKSILAEALADMLPDAVIQRRGKVAYNGVWMRAYAVHADHIARTFERTSEVLSHIGISPAWLLRRTRELADWRLVSDREILGAYAIAIWLLAWGIERVTDVDWE